MLIKYTIRAILDFCYSGCVVVEKKIVYVHKWDGQCLVYRRDNTTSTFPFDV